MSKPPHPKAKAMALIRRTHNGRVQILGSGGTDPIKGETFLRLIGGHIEMGETAAQAVLREIKEELGIDMTITAFHGWIENIFTYRGEVGHEIIALFDVTFPDDEEIRDSYDITDTDHKTGQQTIFHATWANIDDVLAGKVIMYPKIENNFLGQV